MSYFDHVLLCIFDGAPYLPAFKYHYPFDDNSLPNFSSTVVYSPGYGVTVYIPAGAILGKEQVEVSLRLVTEQAEIKVFLSHSMFEGSVLCSGVHEFEAKLVGAPDDVEFSKFHSDVWIEFPHCLSFGGCSPKDYSTAFVVSESRGKVEVEEQALFSEGYPYVNLPVRHFSKFCVIHTLKKRFGTTRRQNTVSLVRKRLTTASCVSESLHKLSISDSFDSDKSGSPHARHKKVKQEVMESATCSSAAEKRTTFIEMNSTSSEASVEEQRQALVRQDAHAHQVLLHQDASDGCGEEDAVEVDQRAPVNTASSAVLQQESVNKTSAYLSTIACICQPVGRDKMERWMTEIVLVPLLPRALKVLPLHNVHTVHCCLTTYTVHTLANLIHSHCYVVKPYVHQRKQLCDILANALDNTQLPYLKVYNALKGFLQ